MSVKSILDEYFEEYYKREQASGVVRVTVKNKTVYQKSIGFADDERKTPFCDSSMFTFYSLSKPFCAIGLLKLKDKGLVNIDAHPAQYVAEARGFDSRVTIRQMLWHISGLPDFEQTKEFKEKYEAEASVDKLREHLKRLTEYPKYFEAGTAGRYANVNFVVCALIIENVSGLKYAEYMKREVFEPLGAVRALVDEKGLFVPNRVKGYALIDGKRTETEKSHAWMFGAGDIIGTVDDVYCLNRAIKHGLLLKRETWEEALLPNPINGMGMGCTVNSWRGKKRIQHNGGHYGFRSLHVQLPQDDFDIIILSNSGFGNARVDWEEKILAVYYGDGRFIGERAMDEGYI